MIRIIASFLIINLGMVNCFFYAQQQTPPPVTILIHGTKIQPHVPTFFSHAKIPVLYRLTHCPLGLHKAVTLNSELHHHQIAKTLYEVQPKEFPLETFYIFGWCGTLDAIKRHESARILYQELIQIQKNYEQEWGQKPIIRIISHSHGGNVALYLAELAQKNNYPFTINELILLACPVQKQTSHYITSPLFEKIYSLHSHYDMLQCADPQALQIAKQKIKSHLQQEERDYFHIVDTFFDCLEDYPLFSERHFKPHSKLIQVNIQRNKRNITHLEFKLLFFVQHLPIILKQLRNFTKVKSQNCDGICKLTKGEIVMLPNNN